MTAEALVCWQLLGLPQDHPAAQEAAAYLLGESPGDECNLYYWYYATLGMYQMQGPGWQTWNDAVQRALLRRQVKQGPVGRVLGDQRSVGRLRRPPLHHHPGRR